MDKYDWMAGRFGCDTSVFTTGPDDLHRIRRGALNPLFSRARIVDLQGIIREKIGILLDRIREFQKDGRVLPINRAYMALTGDVVSESAITCVHERDTRAEHNMPDSGILLLDDLRTSEIAQL